MNNTLKLFERNAFVAIFFVLFRHEYFSLISYEDEHENEQIEIYRIELLRNAIIVLCIFNIHNISDNY